MNQPALEVADIFRAWAGPYIEPRISWPQHKVMRAIERCRTAALGKHRDQCTRCGHDLGFSFNCCRNRHCPKCQTQARNRWVAARTRALVPLTYFHAVFTVPQQLSELILQNKRLLYELLFRSLAATLLEVAANPKHLGAEIGFLGVLHTWGQTLMHHPHIHCVAPAGGFAPGRTHWVRPKYAGFFLPQQVLSEVFRGKFTDGLKRLFQAKKLAFHGSLHWLEEPRSFARFLHTLHRHKWVVYVKKPFGGPEYVLHYLARYTHRVAISNHRLIGREDGKVTFRWRDYAHDRKQRKMTLAAEEFIRRFLRHVLPKGLVRIRYYGWMANRRRRECAALCRALLATEAAPPAGPTPNCPAPPGDARSAAAWSQLSRRSSPASYHVRGQAEDVNSIRLRSSHLLASHADRAVRTVEVCLRPRTHSKTHDSACHRVVNWAFHWLQGATWTGLLAVRRPWQKHQNTIQTTYPPAPRPPQTRAAHFKRLYRK